MTVPLTIVEPRVPRAGGSRMRVAVDGSEDRFRALFAEQSRALLTYALRRVPDPADAADVVAEVFLVAWRRLDDVPPGAEARLWLFGVARRVVGNQRRGELRRSKLAGRLRQELSGLVTPDLSSDRATAQVVRTAMARLDGDDRELLWLTGWEGLTPGEIAVVFDQRPGTVRSRLPRRPAPTWSPPTWPRGHRSGPTWRPGCTPRRRRRSGTRPPPSTGRPPRR